MRLVFITILFIFSSFLHAQRSWKVKEIKGIVEAIDLEDHSSSIINLSKGCACLETYMISVGAKNSSLVLEDKAGILAKVGTDTMIGLGKYKQIASDMILIRGNVRFIVPKTKEKVNVETSSLKFQLAEQTDVSIDSIAKEDSYETTFCAAFGKFDIKDINGTLISKIKKGRKQTFWKKRKNTDVKCELTSEITIPKKIIPKKEIKKPEPPKIVKKVKEEDTYTVGGIEQELFNEIQSDDELQKELIKISKDNPVELSDCKDCEKKWGKVLFNVPEGINYVSPDIYMEKTLPATFFQLENNEYTNKVFTGYKQGEAKLDAKFSYFLPEGKYYATIIKGPAFLIEVKSLKEAIYNISAFVSAGINAEIILPLGGGTQSLIPSKTAPMFVYPGNYFFNIIKKGQKNKKLELNIKPGAVSIVSEEKK